MNFFRKKKLIKDKNQKDNLKNEKNLEKFFIMDNLFFIWINFDKIIIS